MPSAASAAAAEEGAETEPAEHGGGESTATAVAEKPADTAAPPRPRRQPRYHVVLWNDDDHTYHYVITMLRALFGHPAERGLALAREVDTRGRVIVLTTTREHAELKRDQIHAFGADRLIAGSKGSMKASIEPDR